MSICASMASAVAATFWASRPDYGFKSSQAARPFPGHCVRLGGSMIRVTIKVPASSASPMSITALIDASELASASIVKTMDTLRHFPAGDT